MTLSDDAPFCNGREITNHWEGLYQHGSQLPWELDSSPPEILAWRDRLDQGMSVLDVGCGRGHHSFAFARHGCVVTGIDLSRSAIVAAERMAATHENRPSFQVSDILEYTTDHPYDFIFDYSVFHHIPESKRQAYIANVSRALKADGFYALVCYSDRDPDAHGQPYRVGRFKNLIYHPTAEMIRNLSQGSFTIIEYKETTLGRMGDHPAHCFLMQKRRLGFCEATSLIKTDRV